MSRIRLLSAFYDEETGFSTVELSTPLGIFTGTANISSEDIDKYGSRFLGCEIAERRAKIQYLKRKNQQYKLQRDTLDDMLFNAGKSGLEEVTVIGDFDTPIYDCTIAEIDRLEKLIASNTRDIEHLLIRNRKCAEEHFAARDKVDKKVKKD